MGKTSTSCFRIITCGSDSANRDDDVEAYENKGLSDKRGWSFRKRSARHRVLSNTVTSETPSSANKESPETASLNFQPPDTAIIPEKISVIKCTDEKPRLSTSADSKVSETIVVTKDDSEVDGLEESVVVIIQAAVRGFLAQRELLKLKNVVKLQAAVRGHLVRQHAVGTLRCVQAIVKMQALVRARRARLLHEGSDLGKKADGKKHEQPISKTSGKENSVTRPNVTYTSIEKLLSNRFARQLMESTQRTKPINIKCDPSKQNSAWNWLERWMSVTSAEPTPKPQLVSEKSDGEKNENFASAEETGVTAKDSDGPKPTEETVQLSESEENLITYDADNLKFQACHPTSSVKDSLEQPLHEKNGASDAKEMSIDTTTIADQTVGSHVNSQTVSNSLSQKPEVEGEQNDQPKRSMKRLASDQLDTEGKKFVFGSRKVSNASFISAQSEFGELSSTANSKRSFSSSYQDGGLESNMDTSGVESVNTAKELNVAENSGPLISMVQYGGSECGTELSVTSTLDSPDISEVGAAEHEHEAKFSEQETCKANTMKEVDVEIQDAPIDPVSNMSHSAIDQTEKLDGAESEATNSLAAVDSPQVELKPEIGASDFQREPEPEVGGLAYRSSPAASPRSHITVPDSQGTPASQLSVKAKRSNSNHKRKSVSAGKRSPSYPKHDSAGRTDMEQLSKEQKNEKRRNSFGSTGPDQSSQEPRDSSSSSSIPHFMQATESARAKISANNSPRSSPDVRDKEYIKKRHSLPGANGRHGSPRIQRSMSQAQQGAKENCGHVVHEKKWQR